MIKRIHFTFRWNQFWIGVSYLKAVRVLFIQPLPMLGIRVVFKLVEE